MTQPSGSIHLHLCEAVGKIPPDKQAVKAFLEQGADPGFIHPRTHMSALMAAARAGQSDILKLLLAKATPEAIDAQTGDSGATALMLTRWADTSGHVICARLLVAAGAALDKTDVNGNTALIHMAVNDRPRIVEILVNAGADTRPRNAEGRNAIESAVYFNAGSTLTIDQIRDAMLRDADQDTIRDFNHAARRGMPTDDTITAEKKIRPRRKPATP